MQGATAGNMQNRNPQQQSQQQSSMMGPNRNQQQPNQPQSQNMMGPNRNQQQPIGANTMNSMNMQQTGMSNMQQQPNMVGPQQQQPNMMNPNMRGGNIQQQQQPITTTQQQSTGLFSSSLFSGPANAAGSMFGGNRTNMGPQVVPGQGPFGQQQQQPGMQPGMGMGQQQGGPGQPGLMQKLGDIASAAPGGDMLSKGKELIFMKFGLGGK